MLSLKDFVKDYKDKFKEIYKRDPKFFESNLIAKTDTADYSLEAHTKNALKELKKFITENNEIFKMFSTKHDVKEQTLYDILFFSVFFHDIGKGTLEFYEDKLLRKRKSYHPLYSIYFTQGLSIPRIDDVDYVTLSVLTHHTLLHKDIYGTEKFQQIRAPNFFKETFKFAEKYDEYYRDFFGFEFPYKLKFELPSKNPYNILREDFSWGFSGKGIIDALNAILSRSDKSSKKKIKEIYGFVTGNLIRGDWLSSGLNNPNFPKMTKGDLLKKLKWRARKKGISFQGLKKFQKVASKKQGNVIIKIPTGEGKTEAALLWALNNIKNKHTKVIYTMPTQVTSNSMYKRFKDYFGNDYVGILHGASSIILAEEYGDDEEKLWREKILNKTFSKPITVSTLDSFILSFFNINKWPLAQLNLENSLLIVDEIHSYDFKMIGVLRRILLELNTKGCNFALMSATFPELLEKHLLKGINYSKITQKDLFEPAPVKLEIGADGISDKINQIIDFYQKRKKVLVVTNTIEKSKEIYNNLKKTNEFKTNNHPDKHSNLILYHSQFVKKDRKLKESEIEEKDGWKDRGLVLVATQVVEISLDINFDVMFTELAPIDALVQRIGRINRRKDEIQGNVFISTDIEAVSDSGRWSYPYRMEIIEFSEKILEPGSPSLGELSAYVNRLYKSLLNTDQILFEFQNKFEDGFKKYDKIIERGPYTIRFKTENLEEISKLLQLRDTDESFETIDVIPKKFIEEEDSPERFGNTVGIYKWLFFKLLKEGEIHKNNFYILDGFDYNYEIGLKALKKDDWQFL